jgi:hypothetical protein
MKSGIQKQDDINLSFCTTVHHGIACDQCGQNPIIGLRYKCSKCQIYNLCSQCEENNSVNGFHPHDFIKMRKSENNNNDIDYNAHNKFNNQNFNNIFGVDKFPKNKQMNNIKNETLLPISLYYEQIESASCLLYLILHTKKTMI